jgi:hypothetical protein
MKKNKLIELLQNIKGNPDIKMWNGLVEDWMDIGIVKGELVKRCEEHIRWSIEAEWKQNNKSWEIPADVQQHLDEIIKQQVREEEWEFPNPYLDEEAEKRWYGKRKKKVVLIDAKPRNKTYADRLGKISY